MELGVDILIAEHDHDVRSFLEEALTSEGYSVCAVADGSVTLDVIGRLKPGLVILELERTRPDETLLLLDEIQSDDMIRETSVLVSSTDPILLRQLAEPLAYFGCSTVLKPFELDAFLRHVARALGGKPRSGC